ncbi:uncharacterized protein [Aegilops tauschii subsp. strangulata]|uniref:Transmembrane protein n=2 Tax=Aegilops tauschii TaxID=37682 RepID=A0A452XQN7_AEGTS|nr:uncharacterized protein LOC109760381 [Aegilops tauschii subsp. strangulata]
MATKSTPSMGPSFFNFLKEGLLLPARNRRLFLAVYAVVIASTALLLLGGDLAVQPLADEIQLDAKALNSTDPGSPEFAKLVQEIQDDTRELLLVGAGFLLLAVVVSSAVRIVLLFAAVSTYSDEEQPAATSLGALLGKAKAQLKGPLLTLAFVYVLEIVCTVLLAFVGALLGVLMVMLKQYFAVLLLASILIVGAATVFLVYFSFLCSFSIVVAVAEPGCHGAAALGRAWRLAKGKRRQVVLYVAVTGALAAVLSPVHTLARTCAGDDSVALGLLLDFVYAVLMALVQLFAVCAMTAFYYERKENSDNQLGATGYAKLSSTEEATA